MEPTHESIDLPIATSESIAVGEGLKKQSSKNVTSTTASRNAAIPASQREDLVVDSEDLLDDDDDEEDDADYDEDDYQLAPDLVAEDSQALVEDSLNMDEATV